MSEVAVWSCQWQAVKIGGSCCGIPCLQRRVGSVIEALQPSLDVLLRNAKFPFSETNSVVPNIQNNTLHFLHCVLVSNRLDTCGLLTIRRYIYGPCRFALAWPLLSSRHFLGFPIGCLTVFSLSSDLKEAATRSSVITWLK